MCHSGGVGDKREMSKVSNVVGETNDFLQFSSFSPIGTQTPTSSAHHHLPLS